jgi:hypothetical protein
MFYKGIKYILRDYIDSQFLAPSSLAYTLSNMNQLMSRSYKFWNYVPSIPAAVIFMLIFMVLTGLHTWKLFRTRSWFCIAFTLGGLCKLTSSVEFCLYDKKQSLI